MSIVMNAQPMMPLETRYNALLIGEWQKLSLSEKKKFLKQLNEFAPIGSQSWRGFLTGTFPKLELKSFAPHQVEFWNWVWAIQPNERPRPFVALWSRGSGKSTSAELAATLIGITQRRAYIIYVSGTQDLADRHVQSIATLLENAGIERRVNKYGSSRGWRRDRLQTNTFTIDAFGLDVGARGIRVDENRPGLIVLDDIDDLHDTLETTLKKIKTLTNTLLPSGSNDCAVLFVQNIVAKDSIAARLSDQRADFLTDRIISGAYPALLDFRYEMDAATGELAISGMPTWEGQSLEDCRAFIKTWGLRAFLRECQHDVAENENGLWKREWIDTHRVTKHPTLTRIVVGVDPPGGLRTECGIVADGIAMINNVQRLYVLRDASRAGSPDEWGREVVTVYHTLQADCIAVEDNFGGAMVEATILHVDPTVNVKRVHATRGKIPRAEPIAVWAQEGREHFVGTFPQLEDELCNYVPGMPSPNRLDAHVWAATELTTGGYSNFVSKAR